MKNLLALAILMMFAFQPAFANSKKAARKPASEAPTRAVQYGGEADYDACGSYGIAIVTTVAKSGGKWEKVEAGTGMNSCDSEEGWLGVVWGSKDQQCGTGSSVMPRKDYIGPCKSGWIKKEFYEMLAG